MFQPPRHAPPLVGAAPESSPANGSRMAAPFASTTRSNELSTVAGLRRASSVRTRENGATESSSRAALFNPPLLPCAAAASPEPSSATSSGQASSAPSVIDAAELEAGSRRPDAPEATPWPALSPPDDDSGAGERPAPAASPQRPSVFPLSASGELCVQSPVASRAPRDLTYLPSSTMTAACPPLLLAAAAARAPTSSTTPFMLPAWKATAALTPQPAPLAGSKRSARSRDGDAPRDATARLTAENMADVQRQYRRIDGGGRLRVAAVHSDTPGVSKLFTLLSDHSAGAAAAEGAPRVGSMAHVQAALESLDV